MDASLGERVGGNLHRQIRSAERRELFRDPIEIERFGRRVDRLPGASGEVILDGPDHGRRVARGLEDRISQISCCRLAIGAGDAGERDRLDSFPVEVPGGDGQRLAAVLDLNPDPVEVVRLRSFADDGDRASLLCFGSELAAVEFLPQKSEEQSSPEPPGVNRIPNPRSRPETSPSGSAAASFTSSRVSAIVIRRYRANSTSTRSPTGSTAPGGGYCDRATPAPTYSTGIPFREVSSTTARSVLPRKFGTVGPSR